MNLLISLLITSFISLQGTAAELNPKNSQILESKIKISCNIDMVEKEKTDNEESQMIISKGLVSESLRTTWTDGVTQYRFSDYRSIDSNGETVSNGRSTTYFTATNEGSRTTETTRSHSVIKYRDDLQVSGGNLQERKVESVSIYLNISPNERILISSVDNGKSVPTRDLRETTTQISDKIKSVKYTEATPYTHEPIEGYIVEVLKSEMTCLFETID